MIIFLCAYGRTAAFPVFDHLCYVCFHRLLLFPFVGVWVCFSHTHRYVTSISHYVFYLAIGIAATSALLIFFSSIRFRLIFFSVFHHLSRKFSVLIVSYVEIFPPELALHSPSLRQCYDVRALRNFLYAFAHTVATQNARSHVFVALYWFLLVPIKCCIEMKYLKT